VEHQPCCCDDDDQMAEHCGRPHPAHMVC
jgi:hypothetical protein